MYLAKQVTTFMNNYFSLSRMLLMLELLKLKFMDFRSKWDFFVSYATQFPTLEKCDFDWQFLFNSYLVIFLYKTQKRTIGQIRV
jgi:hypothetical protein